MGATDNKIFEIEIRAFETDIRAFLNAGAREPVSTSNNASDVLSKFELKQASSLLKLKIFKMKLEAIIVAFETYIDPQTFPKDSVKSIKDALNYISIGFYQVLNDRSMESTTINILKVILKPLLKAQTYVLEATTLLDTTSSDEEEKIRWSNYYTALLDCRHQMFEVKGLLGALKLEPT